jgi:uncharacterized protein YjiK
MSLIERPNLMSLLILGGVVLIAGGYGLVTYTQAPELEHYDVDPDYDFGYDFERPDNVVELPKDLEEISGMASWFTEDEVIAVQDEDGKLFIVDVNTGNIKADFKFGKDRDYEGICRVDSSIYVLERDGDVHRIQYVPGQNEYDSKKTETDFSYRNDTEGICYDRRTNSLLIVPKDQGLNPQDNDYRRGVYAVDLATEQLEPQPRFYVDEFAVGEAVYGKRKPYKIKPSGVAVDPLTGDIYVIASVGNIMVVIDRESDIKHIELLKEKTFTQPEGITFNKKGDLFISSEGRGGKALIVTFRRKVSLGAEKVKQQ